MQEFEEVVWGLADLYDIFLEALDKRIQNSNLKKVTRMGEYEWHVSDSGSKSYILVYQRGNDIICWLKIGTSGILSFILPLVTKIEVAVRNAITEADTDILMEGTTKPTPLKMSKRRMVLCPNCGSSISRDINFCPKCGSELEKCIICNLVIGKNQKIAKCPSCGGLAHRTHFLEYLRIKTQCPTCGKWVKKEELV